MQRRQVLANSCARAASAEEARFRIDNPIPDERSTAVFALDAPARAIVETQVAGRFPRVHFLACSDRPGDGHSSAVASGDGEPGAGMSGNGHWRAVASGDGKSGAVTEGTGGRRAGEATAQAVPLRDDAGAARPLAEVVADADLVVMVATAPQARAAAAAIGGVCERHHVMAAGLALGAHDVVDGAVSALRPHSRMLLVSDDATDLGELLVALRA